MNDSLSGIVIFVCLVSFIQYVLTKDKSYLYYGGYVFANGFYFVEFKQVKASAFVLLPFVLEYKDGLLVNALLLSYICSYMFYEHFFQLKKKSPDIHRLFRIFVKIQITVIVAHTLLVYGLIDERASQRVVSQICILPVMIISFIAYYKVYKIGTLLSRIIFIGTGFFLVGSVIGFIRSMHPEFLSFFGHFLNSTKIGFVLELVFFSIALAYRSVILKGEKEQVIKEKELIQFQKGFYTNIAHEIRTPLTMILGLTNELKGEEEYKQKINIYGNQLLQLTDKAINRSQLESGNIVVRYTYDNILPFLYQHLLGATEAPIGKLYLHQDQIYMDYDQDILAKLIDRIMYFISCNKIALQLVELHSNSRLILIKFIISKNQSSDIASKWDSYVETQLLDNYTSNSNMSIDAIRDSGSFQICLAIHSDTSGN